jgi:putative DNA primase/helicase
VVTGRTDWQKYLELIGAGGTGKSTFTRLAIALVGANNTHTTTLKKLEGERFETASIAGKRLVLINDSERYAGSVSTLKALTGQDTLPYEVKFKQSTGGFTPNAMVIVAANETIQSGDYTSGLERRRITVPMFNKISSEHQRNLIEHRNGEILGEFAQYIPGLLNWVLAMDESEATRIIRNYQKAVPKLAVMKAQTLVETNPIADWLDNNIVYKENYRTNIGVANRDKDNSSDRWYLNTDKWLYANYAEYCHSTGTKSIGLRRFGNLLSDLCKNQLELNIEKGRDRLGSYVAGLKIRSEYDSDPPIITGKNNPPDDNLFLSHITHNTCSIVTDVMNSVTDSVTDKSIDGDKCDGCDGYFESQSQELNSEKLNSNDITAINEENLPSHPSHNVTQSIDGDESEPISNPSQQPSQSVTPSVTNHHNQSDVIKEGSHVNIINCPGHCLWAQPFKVLSVKNGMAELEMYDKLVDLDQLEQIREGNGDE